MEEKRNNSEKIQSVLIRVLLGIVFLAIFALLVFTGISMLTDSFVAGIMLIGLSIALLVMGVRFLITW